MLLVSSQLRSQVDLQLHMSCTGKSVSRLVPGWFQGLEGAALEKGIQTNAKICLHSSSSVDALDQDVAKATSD